MRESSPGPLSAAASSASMSLPKGNMMVKLAGVRGEGVLCHMMPATPSAKPLPPGLLNA